MSKLTNFACDPRGIRVWRGFRSLKYLDDLEGFKSQLGEVFIPITVQMMEPLGLRAYFPALTRQPLTKLEDVAKELERGELGLGRAGIDRVPDEVALVAYSDKQAYKTASKCTVYGRAYGALHQNVFNFEPDAAIPTSKSEFPQLWQRVPQLSKAYYLCAKPCDWRNGDTSMLMGYYAKHIEAKDIVACVNSYLSEHTDDLNGAIIVIEQGYLLFWQNTQQKTPGLLALLGELLIGSLVEPQCQRVKIAHAATIPYQGIDAKFGEFYDVRLSKS